MAIKTILTEPHPVLRQEAEPVEAFDRELATLINDLRETLESETDPEGVGIAAPQIGVSKQVILVKKVAANPDDPKNPVSEVLALVNPEILKESAKKGLGFEGCLSVPDRYGQVWRAKKIKVRALDAAGKPLKFGADGFFARIIQHEVDHLNGILFIDKVEGNLLSGEELSKLAN